MTLPNNIDYGEVERRMLLHHDPETDPHAARATRDGISRDAAKLRNFAKAYGAVSHAGDRASSDFVPVGHDDPTIVGYPRTRERRFSGLVAVLVGSVTWLGLAIAAGWFFAWVTR